MKKFEYAYVEIGYGHHGVKAEDIEAVLNDFGQKGYQVVGFTPIARGGVTGVTLMREIVEIVP